MLDLGEFAATVKVVESMMGSGMLAPGTPSTTAGMHLEGRMISCNWKLPNGASTQAIPVILKIDFSAEQRPMSDDWRHALTDDEVKQYIGRIRMYRDIRKELVVNVQAVLPWSIFAELKQLGGREIRFETAHALELRENENSIVAWVKRAYFQETEK